MCLPVHLFKIHVIERSLVMPFDETVLLAQLYPKTGVCRRFARMGKKLPVQHYENPRRRKITRRTQVVSFLIPRVFIISKYASLPIRVTALRIRGKGEWRVSHAALGEPQGAQHPQKSVGFFPWSPASRVSY